MIPARQRDVLYCLHDAGSVSVKVRKRTGGAVILASPLDAPADSVSSLGQCNRYQYKISSLYLILRKVLIMLYHWNVMLTNIDVLVI